MVDSAAKGLDSDFDAFGRERQLMEQIKYKLLLRWFVGFSMGDGVRDQSMFSKNREPLLIGEVAHRFFAQVHGQADRAGLLSQEHFGVDGRLIEVLAALQRWRPKDEDGPTGSSARNPSVDFHGEKRSRGQKLRHPRLCQLSPTARTMTKTWSVP